MGKYFSNREAINGKTSKLAMACVVLVIFSLFADFGNYVFIALINTCACVHAIILTAVAKSKKNANLFALLLLVIQLIFGLIPDTKTRIIGFLILTVVYALSLLVTTVGEIKIGDVVIVFIIMPLFTSVQLLKLAITVTYEENVPFLIPMLIISGVVGIISIVKNATKKKKFFSCVGWFLLIFILAFALLYFTVCDLNYALDRSVPTEYAAVIQKKEINRTRRGPDDYKFEFNINGNEISLSVPSGDYSSHEVGDYYRIVRYEGAFAPFYMSKEYIK